MSSATSAWEDMRSTSLVWSLGLKVKVPKVQYLLWWSDFLGWTWNNPCNCSIFRDGLVWEIFSCFDATVWLSCLFVLAKSVRPSVHRHGSTWWWNGVSGSKSKPQDLTASTNPFRILPSPKGHFKIYLYDKKLDLRNSFILLVISFQQIYKRSPNNCLRSAKTSMFTNTC